MARHINAGSGMVQRCVLRKDRMAYHGANLDSNQDTEKYDAEELGK